jgi:predicted dehydrogenase
MTRPLRIGFIGGHGHHYLKACRKDPSLDVTAVAWAPGHDDADHARKRCGGSDTWFDSAEALLDTFKPDVVNIGTLYAHNTAPIVAALGRDIPVVTDKPTAASAQALQQLESAAAATTAPLITEYDRRSHPALQAARAAVADGRLGIPVLASAQKSYRMGNRPDFYRRRSDYGGTLLWVACHGIDMAVFVLAAAGVHPTRVQAHHANVAAADMGDMEDQVACLFTLSNGASLVVHADYRRPAAAPTHGDDRLRVAGDAGVLEFRDDRCELITADQPPQTLGALDDPEQGLPIHRDLLAAALDGQTDLYSTAHSLHLARLCLAARAAADTGQAVALATDA